jgi:hypothetical protein
MNLDEIKMALDGGKIKKNGDIDPDLGNFIIENAKQLSHEIKNYTYGKDFHQNDFDPLTRFAKQLELILWCYPIENKKVDALRVNRLKSMFCGPFFTSEKFPWPEIDGRYAEPIVQLNLEEIEQISPFLLGSGMLQLWAGEFATDDFFIRIVPRDEITKENMSPVPGCIKGEYYGEVRWGGAIVAWPEDDYKKNIPCAYEISNYSSQKLSWPGSLEDQISWFEDDVEDITLMNKINEFISIFPYDHPSTEPHLFGSFDAIQYDPIDTNPTFLALEGKPCFSWNYGNAQISYRQNDKGEVEFGFAWSCQ